jgi:hypothetical protein
MTKKSASSALFITPIMISLLVFCPLQTMAAPTAKMVNEVVDYFYNGQQAGPILADAKLCKSIEALDCEGTVDVNAVPMGEPIKVWMQFFVPKGATYDDIIVEYKHEGVPRNLTAHKVEGSIRYRVVDRFKLDKPGKWTITIKKGVANLKEFKINVTKK